MNNEVKQVLFGSLMGDGCLSKEVKGVNVRFSEKHSFKQKDYLLWKKNIFEREFILGKTSYEKDKKIIGIRSHVDKRLTRIRILFYPNGKKIVTQSILNQLNSLGLAAWYCDDGTYQYQSRYCRIYTYNFNYRNHLLIQKYFKERYKIDCQICIDARKKLYIHMDAKNTKRFLKLVKPIFKKYRIPSCMWYKLGHSYKGNKERMDLAREEHRESNYRLYQQPKNREKKRLYYQKNRERILKQRKIYSQKSEVKKRIKWYMKEYGKIYRIKNRDKINEYKREWRKRRKI